MNQLFTIYFVFTYVCEPFVGYAALFFGPVGIMPPFLLGITFLSFPLALLHVRLVQTVLSPHKTDPPAHDCVLFHAGMGAGSLMLSIESHYDDNETIGICGIANACLPIPLHDHLLSLVARLLR
ncbi:hypothetical protein BDR03DRAFT_974566 [Suillus americanus]|nr:hypothetical protein BDR03DRAFT_974566 [Suillus americanus]